MIGEELFQALQKMTPEERKLPIVAAYEEYNGEGSSFETTKDVDSCNIGDIAHNGKSFQAIVLG